jgi:hypothetical protein
MPLQSMTICPSCAKDQSVDGHVVYPGSEDGTAGRFYPKGLKFFMLARSVPLDAHQPFCACTNCGHVWSYLNPAELRSLLARGRK